MRTDTHTAVRADELAIDWLTTPGRVFAHPRDVLNHPALDRAEKRAILASWASDVRAVENEPALRQIECGAIVPLSEILSALRALDGDDPAQERFSSGSGGRPQFWKRFAGDRG